MPLEHFYRVHFCPIGKYFKKIVVYLQVGIFGFPLVNIKKGRLAKLPSR